MYFGDHGVPHFHIRTPNGEAKMAINTLAIIVGNVDKKTQNEVRTWAANNRTLLHRRWQELSEEENE